ncbi:MAG: hypothetical protein ACOYXU_09200 [Nitrospirota bacterium]
MRKGVCAAIVAVVIGLGANVTWAEEFPDGWALRVGGFLVRNYDTTIRLDAAGQPLGATIDFGDTLGGEASANVARVDGYYRFSPKHRLDASYYRVQRQGSRRLDVDIQWGDQSFLINDVVDSEIDSGVVKLGYTYSFYHNDDVELGVSAGLHTSIVRASLSSTTGQSEAESVTAPLPVVGFLMDYHITPRWTTKLSAQYFFFSAFGIRGLLTDAILATEYRFTRHLGAGIGLNHYANGVEYEGDNAVLTERSAFTGFLAYVSASY